MGFSFLQMDGIDDGLEYIGEISFTKIEIDAYVLPTSVLSYLMDTLNRSTTGYIGVNMSGMTYSLGTLAGQKFNERTTIIYTTTNSSIYTTTALRFFYSSGLAVAGRLYNVKVYNGDTLQAHYDLTTGTANDLSGNGRHATLVGSPKFITLNATYVGNGKGYKIFEPIDSNNPNPLADNVVKVLKEGLDFDSIDNSIIFDELASTSNYLTAGEYEYRYFAPYDDENVGTPSNMFFLMNLMPPTNIQAQVMESDEIKVTFTPAESAMAYRYTLMNMMTYQVTEGRITNNESILNLDPNTPYELKIASLNVDNESTEWSETVTATTLSLFLLKTTASDRHIIWEWEHDDSQNMPVQFELVNTDTSEVLYTGTDRTFDADSPTTIHNNMVTVTYDDATTRNTRVETSIVYDDGKINQPYQQTTFLSANDKKGVLNNDFFKNLTELRPVRQTFGEFVTKNVHSKNLMYSSLQSLGSYRLTLFNHRYDNHRLSQDTTRDSKFNSYAKIGTYLSFSKIPEIKYTVNNSFKENLRIRQGSWVNRSEKLPVKSTYSTNLSKNVYNKFIVVDDGKLIIKPRFYIRNSRQTQYGLKLENFNDRFTYVTTTRQKLFNPTTPFDIDHKDVIINATITNIDIQSQVNKVRILCVGDSITAGAPSYDPQYGGTVWMPDLITGKVKTRNVIESQYPYWLQTRLGIDDFEVINEGSGRRTSTEIEFHIERQMEQYKPEYVIIMIGTNDIFSAQDSGMDNLANTVNTTLSNIRRTVDKVKEYGGIPILGTQLPRNSIVPPEAKNALRNLNAGIKNLGIEYAMDIIDWYNDFVQKDSNGIENGVLRYDLTVDDTHPSIDGYKKMAYTINLGIFNSFRASLRMFSKKLGEDVDYSSEESKVQPDPYTLHYNIKLPEMRRLQRYVFNKYIKNTGNSWGLFTLQLTDEEDICEVWDEKNQVWTDYLIGSLAPNQIMELKMRYIMPATGTNKEVDFNIDYIVKR